MSPEEVIDEIKKSKLRGRGGAGFPTGHEVGVQPRGAGRAHYVDLQRRRGRAGHLQGPRAPHRGAGPGVRGHDHRRLRHRRRARASSTCAASTPTCEPCLEQVLAAPAPPRPARARTSAAGEGFDFDIRIQMGAGRLRLRRGDRRCISSCEGQRGDPRDRPPFPAQKGYLRQPTVGEQRRDALLRGPHPGEGARLVRRASAPRDSTGTKLLSVSGDCERPGRLRGALRHHRATSSWSWSAARTPRPCRSAGPRADASAPKDFGRTICYDDLATGGSIMVFGPRARPARASCRTSWSSSSRRAAATARPAASATCCCKRKLEKILAGRGTAARPRLPRSSWARPSRRRAAAAWARPRANPVLTTLQNFRELYEARSAADGLHARLRPRRGARPRPRPRSPGRAVRSTHEEAQRMSDDRHVHDRRHARSTASAGPDDPARPPTRRASTSRASAPTRTWCPAGSCRVCTVLVNGRPQAACTQPVAERHGRRERHRGAARASRSSIIEMLFVEGNHFCMFCEKSGNCELQALAYRFGITAPRYPYLFPAARRGRLAPGRLHRPQPLHPLRPLRARLARPGRQERLRVRRPRHRQARWRSTPARGLGGHRRRRRRPGRRASARSGAILRKRVGLRRARSASGTYDHEPIGSDIEAPRQRAGKEADHGASRRSPPRRWPAASAATCRSWTSTSAS